VPDALLPAGVLGLAAAGQSGGGGAASAYVSAGMLGRVRIETLGPYRLEHVIGRGGMGEVWQAVDSRKQRRVALKVLASGLAGDVRFVRRFLREAAVAAKLSGPHVVPIHAYGQIDGRLFIEMPLIAGTDLASIIEYGPLASTRAISIVTQAAHALDTARLGGVVHRDVKPSNILVTDSGGGADFVYLIDFGIARALDGTRMSLTGAVVGTPAYMAPEQFDGDSDHRSDVYSLACVLYEALTGRPPFVADDVWQVVVLHHEVPPPKPTEQRPGLPLRIDEVIARGMAKDPDLRFETAGELASAAGAAFDGAAAPAALDEGHHPVPEPGEGSEPKPARRRVGKRATTKTRWRITVGTVVVGALLTSIAYLRGCDDGTSIAETAVPRRPTVVSLIAVDVGAKRIAVSPDGSRVYLTHNSTAFPGNVTVIDTGTNAVSEQIIVGDSPWGLALSKDGGRAYVTNANSSSMTVIDTRRGTAIAEIPAGGFPQDVVISADQTLAYVLVGATTSIGPRVLVIDIQRGSTAATVPVNADSHEMALSPDGAGLYVTNRESGTVSMIDLRSANDPKSITVGGEPTCVDVSADGARLYVANSAAGTISVVDTAKTTIVDTVAVGGSPSCVVVSPDGQRAYVSDATAGGVSIVDLRTGAVTDSVRTGGYPDHLALSPDGTRAYVIDSPNAATVSVVDTGT